MSRTTPTFSPPATSAAGGNYLEGLIAADPRLQEAVRLLSNVDTAGAGRWAMALEASADETAYAEQPIPYTPSYGPGRFLALDIGVTPYRIWLVKGLLTLHGKRCLGVCSPQTCEIFIGNAQPMHKRRSVFSYEFAHVVSGELGAGTAFFQGRARRRSHRPGHGQPRRPNPRRHRAVPRRGHAPGRLTPHPSRPATTGRDASPDHPRNFPRTRPTTAA